VGALAIIWSLWLYRNDKIFNDKYSSHASFLPVCNFAPFMVVSSTFGELRPIYGDIYTVGGHGKKLYYLTWVAS
jgi:hypothetical protein